MRSGLGAAVAALALVASAAPAAAQTVEISPFGGYRFGAALGDFPGAQFIQDNGGVCWGAVVDVAIGPATDGLKFEVLFSREHADVGVYRNWFDQPTQATVTVDHLMIGGIQELDDGVGRPFIGGLIGLSRYDSPGATDVRFTLGLNAGGKFYLSRHVGLRLDGRVYMTIISLSGSGVCSGSCVVVLNANPAFQADLTAGFIVAF